MADVKKKRKPYRTRSKVGAMKKAKLVTLIEDRILASVIFQVSALEDNVDLVRAVVVTKRELDEFIQAL